MIREGTNNQNKFHEIKTQHIIKFNYVSSLQQLFKNFVDARQRKPSCFGKLHGAETAVILEDTTANEKFDQERMAKASPAWLRTIAFSSSSKQHTGN